MTFLKPSSERKHRKSSPQNLSVGQTVEVRSEGEVLSTLDEKDTLDGLPFMPEMRRFCGKRFKVLKKVEKLIIEGDGTRRMKDTVILDGVTCDGDAHEGCGKTCPILWKGSWLEKVDNNHVKIQQSNTMQASGRRDSFHGGMSTCQSINLFGATSPIPKWDFRQYFLEMRSGMYKPIQYPCVIVARVIRSLRRILLVLARTPSKTPSLTLNLQPGELVEVKSMRELLTTLDASGKNRGLEFVPDMAKYCGKRYRVLKRLDRMMNTKTRKNRQIANTVILEGVTCDGKSQGCQRTCYCLWREIWLKRVMELSQVQLD